MVNMSFKSDPNMQNLKSHKSRVGCDAHLNDDNNT